MGKVYRAMDTEVKEEVALKLIFAILLDHADLVLSPRRLNSMVALCVLSIPFISLLTLEKLETHPAACLAEYAQISYLKLDLANM